MQYEMIKGLYSKWQNINTFKTTSKELQKPWHLNDPSTPDNASNTNERENQHIGILATVVDAEFEDVRSKCEGELAKYGISWQKSTRLQDIDYKKIITSAINILFCIYLWESHSGHNAESFKNIIKGNAEVITALGFAEPSTLTEVEITDINKALNEHNKLLGFANRAMISRLLSDGFLEGKSVAKLFELAGENNAIALYKVLKESYEGYDYEEGVCFSKAYYANNSRLIIQMLRDEPKGGFLRDTIFRCICNYEDRPYYPETREIAHKIIQCKNIANAVYTNKAGTISQFSDHTLLTYSAENGNKTLLTELLKENSIDINMQNNNGDTALMCAIRKNNVGVVRDLLECEDIDLEIANHAGESAQSLAEKTEEIKLILTDYTSRNQGQAPRR